MSPAEIRQAMEVLEVIAQVDIQKELYEDRMKTVAFRGPRGTGRREALCIPTAQSSFGPCNGGLSTAVRRKR
jgi:hypothetical protein